MAVRARAATDRLVGLRFADGEYTITRAENARLCRLVKSPPLPEGIAHPVWCHLATHIGKSVSFPQFAELVGAPLDCGFLFGGGELHFSEPLRLDRRYVVRGGIETVESRVGRRTGRFDVITTLLELIDTEVQRTVSRCREDWIVPRERR
jgi:hypothetical protein